MIIKPNIIMIMTDQQSNTMMSCAGNENLSTPNIDSLAKSGIRFETAVCANPVCIPSRFTLFTGHMPEDIGMRSNLYNGEKPNNVFADGMGNLFKKAGYRTIYGGKEHFPKFRATDIGFDYVCVDERDKLADYCKSFLSKQQEQPFLLVVSFINPHDICMHTIKELGIDTHSKHLLEICWHEVEVVEEILKDYDEKYSPKLPDNHMPQEDEPDIMKDMLERLPFKMRARNEWLDNDWRIYIYIYHKLTERVDAQIGKVLDGLYNGPNKENTLIVFTSDHGDHDGSHKLEHKTALYKEAVEVPLILSFEGNIPKGTTKSVVSSGLDLLPTLLDYANIKTPETLKGISFKSIIEKQTIKTRKWTPVESEFGRALWSENYIYTIYDYGENREQLYNRKTDIGQTKNVAHNNHNVIIECRNAVQDFWTNVEFNFDLSI